MLIFRVTSNDYKLNVFSFFFFSWPAFYSKLNIQMPTSWKRQFQAHYSCIRNVEHFLSHLAETCYTYEEVPEKMFVNLTNFIEEDPYHEQCIIDYLEKLLQNSEWVETESYFCLVQISVSLILTWKS